MTIQIDLTFADIAQHQAELRHEASQWRLAQRSKAQRHWWNWFLQRRSSGSYSAPTTATS